MSTSTLTVVFADMVDSSQRLSSMGDDLGDAFMERFVVTLDETIKAHGGRTVKRLGDGVMAVFDRSVLDAIRSSRELHTAAAALDEANPPLVRVGISLGEVTSSDGDYYGRTVVEASRLCAQARSGTTLVSPTVKAAVGSREGAAFHDVGPLELKGLPGKMMAARLLDDETDTEVIARPRSAGPRRRRLLLAGAAAAVGGVGIVILARRGGDDEVAAGDDQGRTPALTADYEPTYEVIPCGAGLPADVVCGVLHVPEDRARPTGRWVDLVVEDHAARNPVAPGATSIVQIGEFEDLDVSPLRDHRTVIRLGVRGLEGKPFLNCPEIADAGLANIEHPLMSTPSTDRYLDAVSACRRRWATEQVDVSQYDAEDVALDVRDLMIARDLTTIDLSADSIHTPAGYASIEVLGNRVRSLMLQNPVPTDVAQGDFVSAFAAAFARLAAACEAQPPCNALNPDLLGSWREAYDSMQSAPQLVTGPLPGGEQASVLLDGDRAALALFYATGERHLAIFVPDLLTRPNLFEIGYNARESSGITDQPYGARLSDLCHRVAPNARPTDAALEARLPQFRANPFRLLKETCEQWNVPAGTSGFFEPSRASVPLLVVHGAMAPGTDIDWVDRVVKGYPRSSLIRFDELGFDPLDVGPACLGELRNQFLDDPEEQLDRDAVEDCVESMPAIPFIVG